MDVPPPPSRCKMWPTILLVLLCIIDRSKVFSFQCSRLRPTTVGFRSSRNTCTAVKKKNKLVDDIPPVPTAVPPTTTEPPLPMTVDEMITDKDVISFMRNGHLVTRGLLPPQLLTDEVIPGLLEVYNDPNNQLKAYKHNVRIYLDINEPKDDISVAECQQMLEEVEKDYIPFLQISNLWYQNDNVRTLALSSELGEVAAKLLGVNAVRLYQDALYVKRSGDGPTPWHSDLTMAPFDTNDFITCWIPLQLVPAQEEGGTALSFASGSHRDFALPYWSDPLETDLSDRYEDSVIDYGGFDVGDCSWHHGWTLHSAPGNSLPETRFAYAVSFIADGTRLLQSEGHIRYPDNEDDAPYAAWIDDLGWGGYADHSLLPVTWAAPSDEE